MTEDKDKKDRKRVVVEEVASEVKPEEKITEPLEEIKENAQEIEQLVEEVKPQLQPTPQPQVSDAAASDTLTDTQTGPNPLVIIIPGVLLLGALLGGIVFYQNSLKDKPEATPTPAGTTLTNEATPTPEAILDLTKYQIKVLNGSGISGEATKVKDLLTDAGFVVSSTGNASDYSYTDSVIQVKDGVDEAFIKELSNTLSKTYSLGDNKALSSTSTDEVVVVVGSTKAE